MSFCLGIAGCAYCKRVDWWRYVFAINDNVVFLANFLVVLIAPSTDISWRGPSKRKISVLWSLFNIIATHEVRKASVYRMPLASSRSDASFFLLAIAANICASASSAFSASVFLASTTYVSARWPVDKQHHIPSDAFFEWTSCASTNSARPLLTFSLRLSSSCSSFSRSSSASRTSWDLS